MFRNSPMNTSIWFHFNKEAIQVSSFSVSLTDSCIKQCMEYDWLNALPICQLQCIGALTQQKINAIIFLILKPESFSNFHINLSNVRCSLNETLKTDNYSKDQVLLSNKEIFIGYRAIYISYLLSHQT